MDASPLLLTVKESARRLSISRTSLYELLLTRQITSLKIGRSRRVPADALVDYVDRLRREQGVDSDNL